MNEYYFTCGTNVYDLFLVPTIRFHHNGFLTYLTVEWLKWYIGIKWFNENN